MNIFNEFAIEECEGKIIDNFRFCGCKKCREYAEKKKIITERVDDFDLIVDTGD